MVHGPGYALRDGFGPVAAVIVAKDADDAVRIANESPYGLGASVWTKDINKLPGNFRGTGGNDNRSKLDS